MSVGRVQALDPHQKLIDIQCKAFVYIFKPLKEKKQLNMYSHIENILHSLYIFTHLHKLIVFEHLDTKFK